VDILRLYLGQAHDPKLLHRAMNVSALRRIGKPTFCCVPEWKEREDCLYRALTGIETAPKTRPCRGA
jgi:hypothetical protein